MARDLNRLMDELRRSREVYVTADATVEDATEAAENATQEDQEQGGPKPRTRLKPEVFGSGGAFVFVADSVLNEAHALALQHRGETGGIGVGPDPFTITELIPSGPAAERSAASFRLDPEYLQPLLERAEAQQLFFNAVWHSHPEGCEHPSGIDRDAARRMLADLDYGLSGHLYLPISVRTQTGFSTRFFVAEGKDARIRSVTPIITSSSATPHPVGSAAAVDGNAADRLVDDTRSKQRGVALRAGTAHGDIPEETPRERRARDIADLEKRDWSATLRSTTGGEAFRLEASGVILWLLLPREYPFSPPDVYAEEDGALRRVPASDTPELVPWSSLHSLAVVAEQARKSVEDLRAVESLIIRPRGFSLLRRALQFRIALPTSGGGL